MSVAAPWRADAPQLLGGSHEQVVRARAVLADGTELALRLDDDGSCQVSFDERRAPRTVGRLTVVADEQLRLDDLDPRRGVRVQLDAGYVVPGTGEQDVHTLVDLGLRDRRLDRPANRVQLLAHGDESLILDDAAASDGELTVNAASIPTSIEQLVRRTLPAADVALRTTSTTPYTGGQLGTDPWQAIDTLADLDNLDVYDAGLRAWVVEDRPQLAALTAAVLRPGDGGTILDSTTTLTRDGSDATGWYNAVDLLFRWTDSGGTEHTVRGYAEQTTGPYAVTGTAGRRRYTETRDQAVSAAEANRAAAALLSRTLSRGRGFELSAIAAYWLRPGHTVTVQLPGAAQERHLVESVDFDLLAGRMRVTTRVPDTANGG